MFSASYSGLEHRADRSLTISSLRLTVSFSRWLP
jgi:hypothetical protein